MTITRAGQSAPQSYLFETGGEKEWRDEVSARSGWQSKLKTVEAAKDKEEGLRARAKGKRGGDASKGNHSNFAFESRGEPETSVGRREYPCRPDYRNPIMAGEMQPEAHRKGLRLISPPQEKKQPKTHKVVNLDARQGCLKGAEAGENAFTILAGAGKKPESAAHGRRCFGNFNAETMPKPQRPTGRGNRQAPKATDPFRYEKEPEPEPAVDYVQKYRQRYGCTPTSVRRTHTWEVPPKQSRHPEYRVNPPYSVDA